LREARTPKPAVAQSVVVDPEVFKKAKEDFLRRLFNDLMGFDGED
jgi:hypothetical protein